MSERQFSLLKPGDCGEDEELCVANIADKDAVMGIEPEELSGFDYVPYTYEKLVSGPGSAGYIYKKQGQVVGFFNTLLVDGGQTLSVSASRITRRWRGGGMFGRFTRRAYQRCLDSNPNLRYIAFDTDSRNWIRNGAKLRKSYVIVEEMELAFLQVDASKLSQQAARQKSEIPGLKQLKREDLHTLLNIQPTHLFPSGRLVLDTKIFRAMKENAELISRQGDSFLGSFENQTVSGNSEQHIQNSGSSLPSLFSCSSYLWCRKGLIYYLSLYGNGSDEIMCAHLEWHVLRLAEIAGDRDAFLYVISPKDTTHVIETMRRGYSALSKADGEQTDLYLLEMDLRR